MSWERAYVAISAALGEPMEQALSSLDEGSTRRAGNLPGALASGDRAAAARVLADALLDIARDVDAMALA